MTTAPAASPSRKRPLDNSYWIIPDRLLAGEHPAASFAGDPGAGVQRLLEAGIDCFVDLTEPEEVPDYRPLLPRRTEYLRVGIPDSSVPLNASQTAALLAAIRAGLARERRVYVHCRAGIGRTGLIVGCLLAEQAGSGRRGLAELNRLWRQSARSLLWPRVPQTAEQAAYVRGWPQLRELLERADR